VPFEPNRLRGIREAKSLTQEDVQNLTGIDHSRIARYERGKGTPTIDNLDRLARALDVTSDYLLGVTWADVTFDRAATIMALEVFERDASAGDCERCRRALGHPDAPRTAKAWRALAEMMALGVGPSEDTTLDTRAKLRAVPSNSK
jgi:transcriptional regulator with XRE-family HTH domain